MRLLAAKASHKWEPSSNGRVGSIPFYECSHQWPLSHLSSLFIRMQMHHLKQKSWMDFLEGSMSPKEEVGCLSRTSMWWDTTLHHLWATNGGWEKVACRKKRKENVKRDLCRSPKKRKKHGNNQILACCRTAVFPYKYILLYFSFLVFPCRAVVTLLFQQLICWLDPFLM